MVWKILWDEQVLWGKIWGFVIDILNLRYLVGTQVEIYSGLLGIRI